MPAEYARRKVGINVSRSSGGHHVNAIPELRAGGVKARSRVQPQARAARSAAALHVAEHSSILIHVMADSQVTPNDTQTATLAWQQPRSDRGA
jgi:hypothetical protein